VEDLVPLETATPFDPLEPLVPSSFIILRRRNEFEVMSDVGVGSPRDAVRDLDC